MDYELTEADNKFFDLIEPLGWGTKTTDYRALKTELLRIDNAWKTRWSTRKLADHCNKLTNVLHKAAMTDLKEDFCCDSWFDTLAHIVGLGRHEFLKSCYSPQKIVDRMESFEYTESFSYALPHKDDYEACNIEYHQSRAAEYVGQITANLIHEDWSSIDERHVENCKLIQRNVSWLALGSLEDFLSVEEETVKVSLDSMDYTGVHYGIQNLYNDVKMYKEFFDR